MKSLEPVAYWLVILGALNWGVVGLLNRDLVDVVLGSSSMLARLVYLAIGASAVWMLVGSKKRR